MQELLTLRETAGNLRQLRMHQNLVDFASNDYLGLARSRELQALTMQEWSSIGPDLNGSTGSRLLTGNSEYVQELEETIARFHGYEAGLLYSCGYMANLGLISAVATDRDCILYDTSMHASMHDALKLTKANKAPFRHNDLNHLESRLRRLSGRKKFICLSSVYSTDGSVAPLEEIVATSEKYGAQLIVDEAHAVGVFGSKGEGLVSQLNLTPRVFSQITTFGKAVGVHGGIVLGSHLLKKFLINFSRQFIYTTALPPVQAVAIRNSYLIFPKMNQERSHLNHLIACWRGRSQIQSIHIKGNVAAKSFSSRLAQAGFDVRPLLSPTVAQGKECLRICLHAFNTVEEINKLRALCAHLL